MPNIPEWEQFERYVQEKLDLRSTVTSGSKWYDQGDGITTGHYSETIYPLMIDAKTTTHKSYSLSRDGMKNWIETATQKGCAFALPVRFLEEGKTSDYVVIPLEDFVGLVEFYRENGGVS